MSIKSTPLTDRPHLSKARSLAGKLHLKLR
jgi:hypothetical protein